MCYSLSAKMSHKQWLDIQEIYGKLSGNEFESIIKEGVQPLYFIDAYKDWHPELPVITQGEPSEVQLLRWGVIPPFAKYIEKNGRMLHPWDFGNYYSKTANAMAEGLAEKTTWKRLYKQNRCLILASGFYEFYHAEGKKMTYPHFITLKDHPVFAFAGLHDEWTDPQSGDTIKTCSIITTTPNAMMKVIHNNPKAHSGSRMPVMLTPEEWSNWLDGEMAYEDVLSFCQPFPEDSMKAIPVRQGLKSNKVNANIPEVQVPMNYPELGQHWSEYGNPKDPQVSLF
ncbi:SOS response-associated peptidase [Roseivirga sp.]|uniref:SOS response-associated peptidase n=1 Tax=Roseivirga sp. TaxID=1964215 RepID=UPI003B8C9A5B